MGMAEKTVLTPGASSGIGLATVLEFARRGFRSVGTVRSEEKADVVADALRIRQQHVARVHEPEDVVNIFLVDRYRGDARLLDELAELGHAVVGVEGHDVDPGDHHLADARLAKLHYLMHHVALGDGDLADLLLRDVGEVIHVTAKEDDMNRTH